MNCSQRCFFRCSDDPMGQTSQIRLATFDFWYLPSCHLRRRPTRTLNSSCLQSPVVFFKQQLLLQESIWSSKQIMLSNLWCSASDWVELWSETKITLSTKTPNSFRRANITSVSVFFLLLITNIHARDAHVLCLLFLPSKKVVARECRLGLKLEFRFNLAIILSELSFGLNSLPFACFFISKA